VLVKQFSRTLPGVGLSPEYKSYSIDTMTRVIESSHESLFSDTPVKLTACFRLSASSILISLLLYYVLMTD